jgi:hypothetical protein
MRITTNIVLRLCPLMSVGSLVLLYWIILTAWRPFFCCWTLRLDLVQPLSQTTRMPTFLEGFLGSEEGVNLSRWTSQERSYSWGPIHLVSLRPWTSRLQSNEEYRDHHRRRCDVESSFGWRRSGSNASWSSLQQHLPSESVRIHLMRKRWRWRRNTRYYHTTSLTHRFISKRV